MKRIKVTTLIFFVLCCFALLSALHVVGQTMTGGTLVGGALIIFDPTLGVSGSLVAVYSDIGVTKDGSDRISLITDQTTNGCNVTQSTDGYKFIYYANQINGYPSFRSDGVDDRMGIANLASLLSGTDKTFTLFLVSKVRTLPETDHIITPLSIAHSDTIGPVCPISMIHTSVSEGSLYWSYFMDNDDNILLDAKEGIADTNWCITSWVRTANLFSIYKNGILASEKAIISGISTYNQVTLGCSNQAGGQNDFSNVDYAAIVGYDSALSNANRQKVENGLNSRYAIY